MSNFFFFLHSAWQYKQSFWTMLELTTDSNLAMSCDTKSHLPDFFLWSGFWRETKIKTLPNNKLASNYWYDRHLTINQWSNQLPNLTVQPTRQHAIKSIPAIKFMLGNPSWHGLSHFFFFFLIFFFNHVTCLLNVTQSIRKQIWNIQEINFHP